MKNPQKVIFRPQPGRSEPWAPPAMDDGFGAAAANGRTRPLTASQVESVQKEAYAEGFAEGRREGLARGTAEGVARGGALVEELLTRLARPLEDLDERVVESLVSLAMSVARHLVRRELKTDPGQVIAVVREAVSALPLASQGVHLYLHPDDAALVRETLVVPEGETAWRVVEEPVLTRGGCRVVTESSQVDATVEQRVAAAIAKVLGEERESEGASGSGSH